MSIITLKGVLETFVHTVILAGPLVLAGFLTASYSLYTQYPTDDNDLSSNITKVGFGIRHFSVVYDQFSDEEDARFSKQQQEALGGEHNAAKIVLYVLYGLMWLCFILPILMAVYNRWWNDVGPSLAFSKLTASLARIYVPSMLLLTILLFIPLVLLSMSNLCGPNYIQLGYREEDASFDEGDWGSDEFVGTYAIVREDIPASCDVVGPRSIGFVVATVILSLFMILQIRVLNRRSQGLANDQKLATTSDRQDLTINQGSIDGQNNLEGEEASKSRSESIQMS